MDRGYRINHYVDKGIGVIALIDTKLASRRAEPHDAAPFRVR